MKVIIIGAMTGIITAICGLSVHDSTGFHWQAISIIVWTCIVQLWSEG